MAIDGTYNVQSEMMGNKMDISVTLKTSGNSLSGSTTAMNNTASFSNGKVNGDNFEFDLEVDSPMGGKMKLSYTGTVKGNDISGEVKTQFGNMPYKGTRV